MRSLLIWTTLLDLVLVVVLLLSGTTGTPLLAVLAGTTTLALWWLPGSRRVRLPSRRLARFLTRRPGRGWTALVTLMLLAAVLGWSLVTQGTRWDPAPGPPWRDGSMLGELAGSRDLVTSYAGSGTVGGTMTRTPIIF